MQARLNGLRGLTVYSLICVYENNGEKEAMNLKRRGGIEGDEGNRGSGKLCKQSTYI